MNQKLSWLLLSTLLGGAVLTGCSEENPKPTNGEGDQNPTSKTPHRTLLCQHVRQGGYEYLLLLE